MLLPACAAAHAHSRLAPADEYFGRQKMSILGIRNALRETLTRINFSPGSAELQLRACLSIENSLEDFGRKYPGDTWLPGMVHDLEGLYGRMHTRDGREHAAHFVAWAKTYGSLR
jgi:hypothetical protein